MAKIFLMATILLLSILPSFSQDLEALSKAKGNKFYGGNFRLNEPEYFVTLFPPAAIDEVSKRIILYAYEGLLTYNCNLFIQIARRKSL